MRKKIYIKHQFCVWLLVYPCFPKNNVRIIVWIIKLSEIRLRGVRGLDTEKMNIKRYIKHSGIKLRTCKVY